VLLDPELLDPELPLEPELPLDPEPPHDMDVVLARRLLSPAKPKAEASSGRTVTNRTKLAAAITATRARCFQVFMPTPFSLSGLIWMPET
jgi:hypothetical protein